MSEKQVIITEMPDGSQWATPAELVAANRATHYADGGTAGNAIFDEEFAHAMGDHDDLIDWAANNMNWDEVAPHSFMLSGPTSTDYDDGWANGEKSVGFKVSPEASTKVPS